MRKKSRIVPLLTSLLIAFAMLAIGRAVLSAPDADVDLGITKNASINPVIAGDPLTYTLNITNVGPSIATGVAVTDTLPAGVTFTTASAGCSYDNTSGRVICTLGNVDIGTSVAPTITVLVNPATLTALQNQAVVGTSDTDTNAANNQALLTTSVTTSADLALSVLESSDPLIAGDTITYTVTITNNGSSDASGVILENDHQPGISLVSSSVLCSHRATS
jgi:uncharacterized repeat protein (TIGR01451 family)